MKQETVDLLMTTIVDALKFAADCELKLVALERVLEKQNPSLHDAYVKEIESLRKQRAYEMNLVALSNLKSNLLRE